MWIEKIAVGLIVLAAAAWAIGVFTRSWRGKGACGCGSGHCPAASETTDRIIASIESNAASVKTKRDSECV